MHDPLSLLFSIPFTGISIWHKDPCCDGSDDSCGRFVRSRHGDPAVVEKIIKRFEFDWDRTYTSEGSGTVYFSGYFCPNGDPNHSVYAIVLNLFLSAAFEMMPHRKARRFVKENFFEILLFAENPVDSLFDGITRKYEIGCGEAHTPQRRKERIHSMAHCIYGWILRETRPWWKSPTFHIHHWRVNWSFGTRLRRWWKHKCKNCGKRITINDRGVVSHSWSGDGPYECGKCSAAQCQKVG